MGLSFKLRDSFGLVEILGSIFLEFGRRLVVVFVGRYSHLI